MSSPPSPPSPGAPQAEWVAWIAAEREREHKEALAVLAKNDTAEYKARHIAAFEDAIAAARAVVELAAHIPPMAASWEVHAKAADRLMRRASFCQVRVDDVNRTAAWMRYNVAIATACAECRAKHVALTCTHRSAPSGDSAAASGAPQVPSSQ